MVSKVTIQKFEQFTTCLKNGRYWPARFRYGGLQGGAKKLVEAYHIGSSEDDDYLSKGNALIRANFNINPEDLSMEQWAERFNEAIWIESEKLKNLAKLLASMLAA